MVSVPPSKVGGSLLAGLTTLDDVEVENQRVLIRTDLDVPQPAATPPAAAPPLDCKDPQLRLRIERVTVRKGGGQLYCVMSATDGASSEVALTTKTKSLGDGESHYFDPQVAVFWGQTALRPTTNNLTLTYNCLKVGSDAWQKALAFLAEHLKGG